MSNEVIKVNIKMPKTMHDRYRAKSERTGVPMNALMYLDLEKIEEQEESIRVLSNVEELNKLIEKAQNKK